MPKMLFRKNEEKHVENRPYPPELLGPDFGPSDVKDFRDFEDYLIDLGHMTDEERVILPEELEEEYKNSEYFNTPSTIVRTAGEIAITGKVDLKKSRLRRR